MSFFPSLFDPRGPTTIALDLVEIDAPDGTHRFMIGNDGEFTDVSGNKWIGSTLAGVSNLQSAIGGAAPQGSITLSFFQDASDDDLIAQMQALGVDYVRGRPIRFYIQPCASVDEMYAPKTPPLLWLTRVSEQLSFSLNQASDRSIALSFETFASARNRAKRVVLNTEGHASIIGQANPSLTYMPTVNFEPEKLFG